MLYGVRGLTSDRKYAKSKATIEKSNTSAIEDCTALGYEFVTKEEFDMIILITNTVSIPSETDSKDLTISEMAEAIKEGVNTI